MKINSPKEKEKKQRAGHTSIRENTEAPLFRTWIDSTEAVL